MDTNSFGRIDGFGLPIRLDCKKRGGGITLHACVEISIKLLSSEATPSGGWGVFVETNLYKKMWLLNCSYNPEKRKSKHIAAIRKKLNYFKLSLDLKIRRGYGDNLFTGCSLNA